MQRAELGVQVRPGFPTFVARSPAGLQSLAWPLTDFEQHLSSPFE